MTLRVQREPSLEGATLSCWFLNGRFECFGLEDEIREVEGQPVATWKVPQKTAIPTGRYRIVITPSARFQRLLPLLVDVPGFTGIRIHPGNTKENTEGCLMPGRRRGPARVLDSRRALGSLFDKLTEASARGEDLWAVIVNPHGDR